MYTKKGSATVFVFCLTAIVGLILLVFVRNSSLFYTFSVDRIVETRRIIALESLAHYAMARCCQMKDKPENWEAEFSHWPSQESPYSGGVKGIFSNSEMKIHATINRDSEPQASIAIIALFSKEKVTFSSWGYGNS